MTRESIIKNLHRIGAVMRRMHGAHGVNRGLHHGQGRLLAMLEEMNGASQGQLADALGIRSPSLTELVDKMQATGLVERLRGRSDGRVSELHLTPAGRSALDGTRQDRSRLMADVFVHLNGEECDRLAALLDKLALGMEESASHNAASEAGALPRRHHLHRHHKE